MNTSAPSLPPIPADSGTCRWCASRRVRTALAEQLWICPAGCADTHEAPYSGLCDDCGREFMTGGARTWQCFPCSAREHEALVAEFADARPTGMLKRSVMAGANRRAVELKRERGAA